MPFPKPTLALKGHLLFWATVLSLYFLTIPFLQVAHAEDAAIPLFRKIEATSAAPAVPTYKLRLLTDADFPPFSFSGADGRAMGLSVDLALAACDELKISCKVETRSFGELVAALQRDEGDAIISGLRLNEKLLTDFSMTRPYFWSFGRFATKASSSVQGPDVKSAGSSSIGVVAGTAHEAWISKYYSSATVKPFKNEGELFTALQDGNVDLIFGDGLDIAFWVAGAGSNKCCRMLGGFYVDRSYFSHNLVFLVKKDNVPLVKVFDYALDRLQENGTTAKLMQRYLPQALW